MIKRMWFFWGGILLASVILSGCETAAGASKGLAYGISSTAEGAAKDTCNTVGAIGALDSWIKKHLW